MVNLAQTHPPSSAHGTRGLEQEWIIRTQASMRRSVLLLAGAAAIASLGYLAVFPKQSIVGAQAEPAQSAQSGDAKTLELLKAVIERIRAEYIDKPDEGKLVEAAINGMLASLRPHSDYLDARK